MRFAAVPAGVRKASGFSKYLRPPGTDPRVRTGGAGEGEEEREEGFLVFLAVLALPLDSPFPLLRSIAGGCKNNKKGNNSLMQFPL
jgi:hypothetical protein